MLYYELRDAELGKPTMFDDTQLESLPADEKLRIVTSLWNQIANSTQSISIPDAVLDHAEHRIEEMLNSPTAAITEEEMWRKADEIR